LICQTKLGEVLESRVVEILGMLFMKNLLVTLAGCYYQFRICRMKKTRLVNITLWNSTRRQVFENSLTTFFEADILAQASLPWLYITHYFEEIETT